MPSAATAAAAAHSAAPVSAPLHPTRFGVAVGSGLLMVERGGREEAGTPGCPGICSNTAVLNIQHRPRCRRGHRGDTPVASARAGTVASMLKTRPVGGRPTRCSMRPSHIIRARPTGQGRNGSGVGRHALNDVSWGAGRDPPRHRSPLSACSQGADDETTYCAGVDGEPAAEGSWASGRSPLPSGSGVSTTHGRPAGRRSRVTPVRDSWPTAPSAYAIFMTVWSGEAVAIQ